MIFVIGGRHNNKLDFVLDKYKLTLDDVYYGESKEEYNDQKIIYNFHEMIKKFLIKGKSINDILSVIKPLLEREDLIIISDEVGYGIVPIKKEDRMFRENCGRVCCLVAKEAKEVYRVMYGIGIKIKGV